jgi:DNA-binding transcriptional regulator GbsR (MarR family)
MLAVADSEDGIVCLTDLARSLGISISNLQQPLRSLVATGLLTHIQAGDTRRKFYMRNPSAAWEWARELQRASEVPSTIQPFGRY